LRGDDLRAGRERAAELLALVGLEARQEHYPHQLSGGEMQRVAFARALIHSPRLVIADEPTGNLDSQNRDRIIEVLREIHGKGLATLVVVTHEEEVAAAASRRVEMADGRLTRNSPRPGDEKGSILKPASEPLRFPIDAGSGTGLRAKPGPDA